jgi:hypothetical protein
VEVSESYPELKCFMYREEKEMRGKMVVLQVLKNKMIESFNGITFEEFDNNRFILFFCKEKIDNHLKQQCNGK